MDCFVNIGFENNLILMLVRVKLYLVMCLMVGLIDNNEDFYAFIGYHMFISGGICCSYARGNESVEYLR